MSSTAFSLPSCAISAFNIFQRPHHTSPSNRIRKAEKGTVYDNSLVHNNSQIKEMFPAPSAVESPLGELTKISYVFPPSFLLIHFLQWRLKKKMTAKGTI
jgi:hypothetical protein